MKSFFLPILFLLISCQTSSAQNQAGKFFLFDWWNSGSITPPQEETVTITNITSPFHKVARDGVSHSLVINLPSGYTLEGWQIKSHEHPDTQVNEATGSTPSVVHTFEFESMADVNVFDLYVDVSIGFPAMDTTFIFPAEVTRLPQRPASFDETWTEGGEHNGSWTDRPGYAVLIESSAVNLNAYDWQSSDPTQPIHFVMDNATFTSESGVAFRVGTCKNCIWDGATDNSVEYGLTIIKTGAGTGNMFTHTSLSTNEGQIASNNIFISIEADGGSTGGVGNTGFIVQTDDNEVNNYATVTYTGLVMSHLYCHDTHEEGFYLFHNNDNVQGSGFRYWGATGALYFRLKSENTGNDGIQISTQKGSELFLSEFINAGLRNSSNHRSQMQIFGLDSCFIYMNRTSGAHNIFQLSAGATGKDVEIFSNEFISTGRDAVDGVNFMIDLDESDEHTTANIKVYHNTFVVSSGPLFTFFKATGGLGLDKFRAIGNIIVSDTETVYEIGGGSFTAATEFEFDNLSLSDPQYVGFVSDSDYHLRTTGSPAFYDVSPITTDHYLAGFDRDGIEFGNEVAGCYSGFGITSDEVIPLPPLAINVNFNGQGNITDWIRSGSLASLTTSPYPGSATTKDFGELGSSGIGLRTLNPGGGVTWSGGGVGNGGVTGGNNTEFPVGTVQSYWFATAANTGVIEFYNFNGTPLTGRTWTIKIIGSRDLTATRITTYTINSGGYTGRLWNNGTDTGTDTNDLDVFDNSNFYLIFSGVEAESGVIRISLDASDQFSYISAIKLIGQ